MTAADPAPAVRVLRDAPRAALGEGALWDAGRGVLWWVDILGRALRRTDPERAEGDGLWPLDTEPGCLALLVDGALLLALRGRVDRFDPAAGRATTVARIEADRPDHRCNDGKPGPDGAFWAGTMADGGGAPMGALYRLAPGGGPPVPVLRGVAVPNALCWSPDGRTMVRCDSALRRLEAHAFDPATGTVGPARTLLDFADLDLPAEAVPDGAAVDARGRVWVAAWDGGCVLAVAPDGRVERRVPLPVRRPTCPAFGGAGLATLFVTSASKGIEGVDGPQGTMLAVEGLGVAGLPSPVLAWDRPTDGPARGATKG